MTVKDLHKIIETVPEDYEVQFGENEDVLTSIIIQHYPDNKSGYVVIKND